MKGGGPGYPQCQVLDESSAPAQHQHIVGDEQCHRVSLWMDMPQQPLPETGFPYL